MHEDPYLAREAKKYSDPIPSREYILNHIAKRRTPVTRKILAQELELTTQTHEEALRRRLRAMERDGQLIFTRRKCYALAERLAMVRGTVIGHRDGYGFLRVDGYKEDFFLPELQMRQVIHGDTILAQPLNPDRRGRCEARVVRILKPRAESIVGRYYVESGIGLVVPDDSRLNFDVIIPPDECHHLRMGQVVVVQLSQRQTLRGQAIGKVIEVLGDHLAPGMEIEIAIRNHNIPHTWSQEVLNQTAALDKNIPSAVIQNRLDLRDLHLVTIDGEDARDFDDAVCAERKKNGWRLWVAIADVSYYVPQNSPLDKEARLRGNSVYFPMQVVPMLPEKLSNDLCSLNPSTDRLCLVCIMTISANGKLTGTSFHEAIMHSKARLTYTQVADLLLGNDVLHQRYATLVPMLQTLHQLFKTLRQAREQRGAIDFDTQETQFIFNQQRRIQRIVPLVRNDAHKMIEECMILANVAAARWIDKKRAILLYRVHEGPDEKRLEAFRTFLRELGLSLGGQDKPTPTDYANLLEKVRSRPDNELIQTMLLRSLQPAIYTPQNRGHFGLSLKFYTHFTSPIRRYPDLLIHRTIKMLLACKTVEEQKQLAKKQEEQISLEKLNLLGEHCSMTEKRADEATREVTDWLKCEFMQDHIGQKFSGIISGVTAFGFFVRLDKLFIDGLVHVSTLDNDYYNFDPIGQRLIGGSTKRNYRLGDIAHVTVVAVHLDQRKIEFELVNSQQSLQGKKTRKQCTKKAKKLSKHEKVEVTSAATKRSISKKTLADKSSIKANKSKKD